MPVNTIPFIRRIHILDMPVDCVDMASAVAAADQMVRGAQRAESILAVNPEKIMTAQRDAVIRQALHSARLCIPDGIGVVLAARLFGVRAIRRVPGSELMPALCELAAQKGYPVFLFGGQDSVGAMASGELQRRYPGLRIAGREHGYVAETDYPRLIERINASGARILFVALGSPRQERWIETYCHLLQHVRVCQGVGGTFDVIAGVVKRAPAAFRRLNLEWAYRLLAQPGRVRRQIALPVFAWRVVGQLLERH